MAAASEGPKVFCGCCGSGTSLDNLGEIGCESCAEPSSTSELPHLCGGCGKPLNERLRHFCVVCEHKGCTYCGAQGHTRDEHHQAGPNTVWHDGREGHIPSQDDGDSSATMQNAARYFLLQALELSQDVPHRLCDLAAMLDRKHTSAIDALNRLENELEHNMSLLNKSVETIATQADTIKKQQTTLDQYGGIIAEALKEMMPK